ncbi:hypothetical protein AJ79_06024 [Helicocarpus griseus UAMH5409]|uniref:Uncharacterized protein n=1 Tax=Helicocarpus griseus UAMH5409 TaxID=1447875 RepID=A0A2B7XI71_9EURO|nr:hypothetical protein AJ79_06024 [Helicocarpus griseus UAMH5409]
MASQQQHTLQSHQSGGPHGFMNNPQTSTSFHGSSHAALAEATCQQQEASIGNQQQPQQHTTHNNGSGQGTAAFLKDFTLVAEAAKRAQMAVIARDLEGVSL